jgi:UDP-2-acetamido-2,6-beta-L-arabino-hexul-4-ose reductase
MRFQEEQDIEVVSFTREHNISDLSAMVTKVDWVFHLAGINRPENPDEFVAGNAELTQHLCEVIGTSGRKVPVVYSSSVQVERDNSYGNSKRSAEESLLALHESTGNPVFIYRLPNVFGKWARPNYNSAVATFCHNIARGLPVQINDPEAVIRLVYIDDVVASFMGVLKGTIMKSHFPEVAPVHEITVGELANQLYHFRDTRDNLIIERVGTGLIRALYSTYVSYLPPEHFTYTVPRHGDERGVFVEMLKTPDCGQFSYFTAHPGVTRGGHYHHSKTEKFLVIKGTARFKFRHMQSGETHELVTHGEQAEIVETVPGWTHDITNIGEDELVCMLWANEIFDRENPDTYACPL